MEEVVTYEIRTLFEDEPHAYAVTCTVHGNVGVWRVIGDWQNAKRAAYVGHMAHVAAHERDGATATHDAGGARG